MPISNVEGEGVLGLSLALPCCCLVSKSCLTLCNPVDHSVPGSFVPGISQSRILEWVAMSFFRGSSWPRDGIFVSCIGRQVLAFPNEWQNLILILCVHGGPCQLSIGQVLTVGIQTVPQWSWNTWVSEKKHPLGDLCSPLPACRVMSEKCSWQVMCSCPQSGKHHTSRSQSKERKEREKANMGMALTFLMS